MIKLIRFVIFGIYSVSQFPNNFYHIIMLMSDDFTFNQQRGFYELFTPQNITYRITPQNVYAPIDKG